MYCIAVTEFCKKFQNSIKIPNGLKAKREILSEREEEFVRGEYEGGISCAKMGNLIELAGQQEGKLKHGDIAFLTVQYFGVYDAKRLKVNQIDEIILGAKRIRKFVKGKNPLFSVPLENSFILKQGYLSGECDLILGDTVFDVKCSRKEEKRTWLVQCYLYAEMLNEKARTENIRYIGIFNPLSNYGYRYRLKDIDDWLRPKLKEKGLCLRPNSDSYKTVPGIDSDNKIEKVLEPKLTEPEAVTVNGPPLYPPIHHEPSVSVHPQPDLDAIDEFITEEIKPDDLSDESFFVGARGFLYLLLIIIGIPLFVTIVTGILFFIMVLILDLCSFL